MSFGKTGESYKIRAVSGGSPQSERAEESQKTAEAVHQAVTASAEQEGASWENNPCIPDQYDRYPSSVKLGPMEFQVFKFTDSETLTAYNALLLGVTPVSAPKIIIRRTNEYFSPEKGEVTISLHFHRLLYLQLTPMQFEQLDKATAAQS